MVNLKSKTKGRIIGLFQIFSLCRISFPFNNKQVRLFVFDVPTSQVQEELNEKLVFEISVWLSQHEMCSNLTQMLYSIIDDLQVS